MINKQPVDLVFMHRALELAAERRGFCAPNPAVGAVVVKQGQIISEGAHWQCGAPHAEVAALQHLSLSESQGASLYVTLEPCAHHGRTPPCTDLIKEKKITEVIYGIRDPNAEVLGDGAKILSEAGIISRELNTDEIVQFYQSYVHWLKHRTPWVTLKIALSLDGKIAGPDGQPLAITGSECQEFTHQRRLHSDAILTTVKTILKDDPQMNVRIADGTVAKPIYILDSYLQLPLNAKIFTTTQSITLFYGPSADLSQLELLQNQGVRCISIFSAQRGLDLKKILEVIGKEGVHDLWVEAGGYCFQSFIAEKIAHEAYIYIAPKILGPSATSAFLDTQNLWFDSSQISWQQKGIDVIAKISLLDEV